jgi:ornithine cyclodeaminase
VKLATVYPDNPARGKPTIQGAVVLFSEHGEPTAILDGATITQMRTAAASALAADHLAQAGASQLLLIGTGALAPFMAEAHAAVRPLARVAIWGRTKERVEAAVVATREKLGSATRVEVVENLREELRRADIVCSATSTTEPIIPGRELKPGAHVDLVGSFSPNKREADDDAIVRSRVFVDTFEGALSEAGDILDPLRRGVITRDHLKGELADLVAGRAIGRTQDDEITLFKSVGAATEDLAAARLAAARAQDKSA